jgi:crossover junction endodeoxyribonuclease RusA
MSALTFTLPWPDSKLWPNRNMGKSWKFRQDEKVEARDEAYYLALEYKGCLPPAEHYTIRYTFHAPTRRKYDLEGAHGAMKPAVDGIAAALGVDDYLFEPAIQERGEPVKGGQVVIRIEP